MMKSHDWLRLNINSLEVQALDFNSMAQALVQDQMVQVLDQHFMVWDPIWFVSFQQGPQEMNLS
jgi:hypothetical protein